MFLNHIKNTGVRIAGVLIYYVVKAFALIANVFKKRFVLSQDTIRRMQLFFPGLELQRVRIVNKAILPANWIESDSKTEAMTFRWTIYAKKSDLQLNYEGILVLIHELVHVQQVRNIGEVGFAARYGEEYINYGYPDMPLEKEAYDFVSGIPFNPQFYLKTYGDINPEIDDPSFAAFTYWLDHGMDEGRMQDTIV